MSISARLLALIVLALSAPLAVVVWISYDHRSAEVAAARADLNTVAGYIVDDLDDKVRGTAQLLYGLSRARDLENPDRTVCSNFLADVLKEYPQFTGLLTISPDGRLVCDSLRSNRNLDLNDRTYFRTLKSSSLSMALQPAFGRLTGLGVLQIAFAARTETGALRFVLLASLNLEQYAHTVGRNLPLLNPVLILTDGKGTVLSHAPARADAKGGPLPGTMFEDLVRTPAGGAIHSAPGFDGIVRSWAVGSLRIPTDAGLYILLGVADRELSAAADRRLVRSLAILGAVSLLVFLGAFLLAEHGIRRPLAQVVTAVERISGGDRAARAGSAGARGEVGILARAVNTMAETIEHDEAALRAATVSEAKRTREIAALFDASPAAIVALDRGARVILWSPAAERLFGWAATEATGRSYADVRGVADDRLLAEFNRVLEGESLRNVRTVIRARDGRDVDVEFSAAPLKAAEGGAAGVAYVVHDIADRVSLERQFTQAQKMEAVGQLTGGIAHDFNNLLAVVIGNLDLLEDSIRGDAAARGLAQAALEAGLRGADLTRQLLAFSRQQILAPKTVDMNALVSGTTKLLRRTLGERIEVRMKLADGLWPVTVDPTQLESALLNLAINARDAMPGGGRLTVETQNKHLDERYAAENAELAPGDYAMLAISDTGGGIPPEILSRVFEPFFTTKATGKGTGLGLSMIYGFAKQSRGHVKIYSEVGHGTTVRLYLPRAEPQANAAEKAEAETEVPGGSAKILAVDDNASVRSVAVRQLASLGYRVIEAESGRDALAMIANDASIDLLFTDIVMPGMAGDELAREARKLRPGLKVLFTSGFAESTVENGDRTRDMAGEHFLAKPYRKQDLARRVREALGEADPV